MPQDEILDGSEGGSPDPLKSIFGKLGVTSVEEAEDKLAEMDHRNSSFQAMRRELREANDKIAALEVKREQEEFGIYDGTDPSVRKLSETVLSMKRTLESVASQTLITPEDREMESEIAQAKDENPELMSIKDPARRLEAYRKIARGIRAGKNRAEDNGRSNRSQSSRAYVERSGGSSQRPAQSEENDLANFKRELEKAGINEEKRDAVFGKYRRMYPDWGI